MAPLTIGRLARQAGVGVETIRYYEREGLIDQPPRRGSGYRQYDPEVVRRLQFIRHAKELGFTLREIRELLDLRVDTDCRCESVLQLAQHRLIDIEQRIEKLERMKQVLSKLTTACRERQRADPCPILEAIDEPGKT